MPIRFSIVVIAYKRKTYLLEAVKSALNQNYPRENFEVVVVKAFHDEVIDRHLKDLGVVTVFSDTEFQGVSLADALSACSCDIICLLDDDDLFTPDKLSKISEVYMSNPGLAVAVNSYDIIDFRGEIVETDFGLSERKLQKNKGLMVWEYPFYDLEFMIMDLNMLFNSSRISFNRSILPSVISISRNISFMVDILFVLLGIAEKKTIASLPQVLTHYRVHEENISLTVNRRNLVEKLTVSHTRVLKDTEALAAFFYKPDTKLSEYFHLWGSMERLKLSMLHSTRKELAMSAFFFIRYVCRNYSSLSIFRSRLFNKRSIVLSIAFVPFFLVSPSTARRMRLALPF